MDDWKFRARCDLSDAADIACCDHVRPQSFDSPDFTLAQPRCNGGLKNIVGSGRTAAQMALRHVLDCEAKPGEQVSWLPHDALTVLKRARRMIGNDKAGGTPNRREWQAAEIFRYVLGEAGNT